MPGIAYHVQSLTELIAKRAREQPDQEALYTAPPPPTSDQASSDGPIDLRALTSVYPPPRPLALLLISSLLHRYAQLARAVDRVAHHNAALGLVAERVSPHTPASALPPVPVVAVLVSSAIDETVLEIALAKAGLAALLLSVNNSAAAVAHLCRRTAAARLIYGPKYAGVAEEARKICAEDGGAVLELVAEKRFPLWGEGGVDDAKIEPFEAVYTPQQERERPAVILHSSGSVRASLSQSR
jgi:acyl-CoA synthetase (AMP-forming)/AMP-acid ligase II